MWSLIAFLATLLPASPIHEPAALRGLGVVPVEGRTEVVIALEGDADPAHFQLDGPARIVLDLPGTAESRVYDDVRRGGVRAIRVAQNTPGVVRVVVDLDVQVEYRVERMDGQIRVSFPQQGGPFDPWATGEVAGILAAPAEQGEPRADTLPPVARSAAAPSTAAGMPPAPMPRQEPQDLRIQMVFDDMPVARVASLLMEAVGRTIVVASGVRDVIIDAEIRDDLPWQVALQSILAANDLALVEDANGILQIISSESAANRLIVMEPLETRTIELEHMSADSLFDQVAAMVSDTGSVAVVTASNALLITDLVSNVERIAGVLEQLDVPPRQVSIKASITFVDRTALEELGVIYDLKDSQGNQLNTLVGGYRDLNGNGVLEPDEATDESVVLLGGNSIAALGNAGARMEGSPLDLVTSVVLGRHTLITFLQALQEVSLSDIQAKPMITAMNHRPSVIQVGEQTPVRVIDAGAVTTGAAQATVDYKDTGVILRVTPHVTGDNVRMEIHAERSNLALGPADVGAIFATQLAQTEVTVRDGETVVIAGLTIEEKSVFHQGIPILMDLPILGGLFRNTQDRVNKRDLIITVTPYIVPSN